MPTIQFLHQFPIHNTYISQQVIDNIYQFVTSYKPFFLQTYFTPISHRDPFGLEWCRRGKRPNSSRRSTHNLARLLCKDIYNCTKEIKCRPKLFHRRSRIYNTLLKLPGLVHIQSGEMDGFVIDLNIDHQSISFLIHKIRLLFIND